MTPEQVVEEVKESNLRGRGGGGFPDRDEVGGAPATPRASTKYVIVNCRRGRPGRLHGPGRCWRAIRTACSKA